MNQLPGKNTDPLKKLVDKSFLEQPSDQFTASVMGKLGISVAPAVTSYEPVISRKGWLFIALISAMFFYLALSGNSTGTLNTNALAVQSTIQNTTSALSALLSGSVALLLTLSALAAFLLIGAESLYRQSRLRTSY